MTSNGVFERRENEHVSKKNSNTVVRNMSVCFLAGKFEEFEERLLLLGLYPKHEAIAHSR